MLGGRSGLGRAVLHMDMYNLGYGCAPQLSAVTPNWDDYSKVDTATKGAL
jgi:hypothetical protein